MAALRFHKLIILALLLFGLAETVTGQTGSIYQPIKFSGSLPEEITKDVVAAAKANASKQKVLAPADAVDYFIQVEKEKQKLFRSGKVYIGSDLNNYVRQVLAKLLQDQPDWANSTKAYVLKSEEINAHALPDGTILITLGLLQKLENEAQLAAIMAHELAHVDLQHSLKGFQRQQQQRGYRAVEANWMANTLHHLRYSRDNENEADARGLSILAASPYSAKAATKAFMLLKDSTTYTFAPGQHIDYNRLLKGTKPVTDSILARFNWSGSTSHSTTEVLIVGNKPNIPDDQLSTHPDMSKRLLALTELLELMQYKSDGKQDNLLPPGTVDNIRKICRYELVQHLYESSEFGKSLFLTLQLLSEAPDDVFLLTLTAKNLYWISHYRDINNVMAVLSDEPKNEPKEYQRLMATLKLLSPKELKELNFNFMKERLEANRSRDDFSYYYALTAESLLGKEAGKLLFQQYQLLHPSGKYQTNVKRKLH